MTIETLHNRYKPRLSAKFVYSGFKKMKIKIHDDTKLDGMAGIAFSSDPEGISVSKKISTINIEKSEKEFDFAWKTYTFTIPTIHQELCVLAMDMIIDLETMNLITLLQIQSKWRTSLYHSRNYDQDQDGQSDLEKIQRFIWQGIDQIGVVTNITWENTISQCQIRRSLIWIVDPITVLY